MVDHPGVGPNYADYAAVDKEFADFMACRSTKGLSPVTKGNGDVWYTLHLLGLNT
jgi:hypothetical protein